MKELEPLQFYEGMRVAALFRISDPRVNKNKLVNEEEKLKSQEASIHKLIENYKLVLKPEHVYHEAKSAFKFSGEQRPIFMEIMAAAQRKEFDVLIVWQSSRFCRNGGWSLIGYIKQLNSYGVQLYSFSQGWLDIRTSIQEIVVFIYGQVDRMESEGISFRVKQHRERKIAEAVAQGVTANLGGVKRVLLSAEELDEMRHLRQLGYSRQDVANHLALKNPKITVNAIIRAEEDEHGESGDSND